MSGFRTAQILVIRSSATSNAATVTATPSCVATRPGLPLTVRSRIVSSGMCRAMPTLWVVTVAHVVVAALVRRRGGSLQPIWYALGFLALTTAQVFAGVFHLTALHVPLAAALLVASLLYLLRIRSTRHHSSRRHLEQAGSR